MNKTEMIAAMAETSGLSKKDCEAALTAFLTATESATSPRPRHLPSSPERLSRTQSSKLNKHPLVHK